MRTRDRETLQLSGTLNGVIYRLGVPNPLNDQNPTPLDERHLPALRALLGFVDPAHVEKTIVIRQLEFARRFPAEHAWSFLVDLLTCWVGTITARGTVVSHFATVSFEENRNGSERTTFVTFDENVISVIKGMLDTSAPTRRRKSAPRGQTQEN